MLIISKKLFTIWNEQGLQYCHWKSNEHLLAGLNGLTDLDVLLSRDDKENGERILKELNFLQCKSQFGARYPNVDDWIGFDSESGTLIHIHLHYNIVTGHKGMKEYSLPWTDLALSTRVLNEEYEVYTMEPNLEMVTLYSRIGLKSDFKNLLRCWRGTFKFPKDVQQEIDWLKERVDMGIVRQMLEVYYKDKAELVCEIMRKETINAADYQTLRKITEYTFKNNRRIKCFVRLKEILYYNYQRWGKEIISKFNKSSISKKVPKSGIGTTIAFIGQDGCGKSTVTMEIQKWLTWKIESKRFYLGSGEHYNGFYKRILSKGSRLKHRNDDRKIDSKKTFTTNNNQKKQKKSIKNFIITYFLSKNHLSVSKRAYKEIRCAERYRIKGGIPLFDRFPQIQFQGIYDGPKIAYLYEQNGFDYWFIKRMATKEMQYLKKIQDFQPNLVFKLMLPPEESIRRKPFENLAAVTRKHEITKQLQFEKSIVYTIDATQDYQQELIYIKNQIWKTLIENQ